MACACAPEPRGDLSPLPRRFPPSPPKDCSCEERSENRHIRLKTLPISGIDDLGPPLAIHSRPENSRAIAASPIGGLKVKGGKA